MGRCLQPPHNSVKEMRFSHSNARAKQNKQRQSIRSLYRFTGDESQAYFDYTDIMHNMAKKAVEFGV